MPDLFRKFVQPLRGRFAARAFGCGGGVVRPESAIPVERIASEFGRDDEVEITQTRARFIPRHQRRNLAVGTLFGLAVGLFLARKMKKRPA